MIPTDIETLWTGCKPTASTKSLGELDRETKAAKLAANVSNPHTAEQRKAAKVKQRNEERQRKFEAGKAGGEKQAADKSAVEDEDEEDFTKWFDVQPVNNTPQVLTVQHRVLLSLLLWQAQVKLNVRAAHSAACGGCGGRCISCRIWRKCMLRPSTSASELGTLASRLHRRSCTLADEHQTYLCTSSSACLQIYGKEYAYGFHEGASALLLCAGCSQCAFGR